MSARRIVRSRTASEAPVAARRIVRMQRQRREIVDPNVRAKFSRTESRAGTLMVCNWVSDVELAYLGGTRVGDTFFRKAGESSWQKQ